MSTLDDLITQAQRRLESNLKVIEFYRQRVASGETASAELLQRFEHSHKILEGNLAGLIDERDKALRSTDNGPV